MYTYDGQEWNCREKDGTYNWNEYLEGGAQCGQTAK